MVGNRSATPDERLAVKLAAAEWSFARSRDLEPPEFPARPPELPFGDGELALLLRAAENMGERANEEDRKTAAAFGEWRYLVWRAEADAAARVECLFEIARAFEEAAKARPEDEHIAERLAAVIDFGRRAWDVELVPFPGFMEARKIARTVAVRPEVLPVWLAAGREQPREERRDDRRERARAILGSQHAGVVDDDDPFPAP